MLPTLCSPFGPPMPSLAAFSPMTWPSPVPTEENHSFFICSPSNLQLTAVCGHSLCHLSWCSIPFPWVWRAHSLTVPHLCPGSHLLPPQSPPQRSLSVTFHKSFSYMRHTLQDPHIHLNISQLKKRNNSDCPSPSNCHTSSYLFFIKLSIGTASASLLPDFLSPSSTMQSL